MARRAKSKRRRVAVFAGRPWGPGAKKLQSRKGIVGKAKERERRQKQSAKKATRKASSKHGTRRRVWVKGHWRKG